MYLLAGSRKQNYIFGGLSLHVHEHEYYTTQVSTLGS